MLDSHQLERAHAEAVVRAAVRLVALERAGGVRSDETAARLALAEAVDALQLVREDAARQARAEDDTRPVRHTPPDPLKPIGGQGPWKP